MSPHVHPFLQHLPLDVREKGSSWLSHFPRVVAREATQVGPGRTRLRSQATEESRRGRSGKPAEACAGHCTSSSTRRSTWTTSPPARRYSDAGHGRVQRVGTPGVRPRGVRGIIRRVRRVAHQDSITFVSTVRDSTFAIVHGRGRLCWSSPSRRDIIDRRTWSSRRSAETGPATRGTHQEGVTRCKKDHASEALGRLKR